MSYPGEYVPRSSKPRTLATVSGKLIDPFTVTAADGLFDIEDAAHALSNACRYVGNCARFYSIAEHSLLVERVVAERWRVKDGDPLYVVRRALVHDLTEYLLGDVPGPLKVQPEFEFYRRAEARLSDEIMKWLGVEGPEPEIVHQVDTELRGTEKADLFPDWIKDCKVAPSIPGIITGVMHPEGAKAAFLARFRELWPNFGRTYDTRTIKVCNVPECPNWFCEGCIK